MKPDTVVQDRSEMPMVVPYELDDAGLTPQEFRIYAHLVRRSQKEGRAWPGRDSIARTCRISKRGVIDAISTLEKHGMLRVQRTEGQRNIYVLTRRSAWDIHKMFDDLSADPASFCTGANSVQGGVQNQATKSTKDKKDKNLSRPGSEAEVINFTRTLDLPDEDGHYFWSHWEGNGFTNNRKPMKNWQATIRSWKLAGHCPSQKGGRNGSYQKSRTESSRNVGTANQGKSSQYAGVGKVL